MPVNGRYIISLLTAFLFIVLVFMNFLGYWEANPVIQILFFFIMVVSIFNAGMDTSKYLKPKG